MILQKTKCPRFRNGAYVLPPQLKKIGIIPLLNEDVFMVIAAVIDVIEIPKRKRRNAGGHDLPYLEDLSGPSRDWQVVSKHNNLI